MFKEEDDDDDDMAITATRYPVMPSLVTLQQMRNRLHLAYLGRKLMKWTALATGKELRKLALEMNTTLLNYAEDIKQAFMLLARARYFYPHLNDVVLENVNRIDAYNAHVILKDPLFRAQPRVASLTIGTSTKSVSGVKVLHLQAMHSGVDPYTHLGIEKGGTAILNAKQAWLNLLKLMIFILEQRTIFKQVELAHKAATKKQNVLTKLIIPRIIVTIAYIMSELEEREREEIFRLKRFKQLKLSRLVKSQKLKEPAPKFIEEVIEDIVPKEIIEKSIIKEKIGDEEVKEEKIGDENVKEEKIGDEEVKEEKIVEEIIKEKEIVDTKEIETSETVKDDKYSLGIFEDEGKMDQSLICPICHLEAKAQEKQIDHMMNVAPCKNFCLRTTENKERLEHLMAHINEVIDLAEQYKSEGITSPSIENFIKTCGTVKDKIEDYTKSPLPCHYTCLDYPDKIEDNIKSSPTCDCPSLSIDQADNIENSFITNQPVNYEDSTKLQPPCDCISLTPDELEKVGDSVRTPLPNINNDMAADQPKKIEDTTCVCIDPITDKLEIIQPSTISPPVCDCVSIDTKQSEKNEYRVESSLPCEGISFTIDQSKKIEDNTKPCVCVTSDIEEPVMQNKAPFLATAPFTPPYTHRPITCERPRKEPLDDFKLTPISDTKLGYFEKKYKEIVKVTRLRNPDGTISEEKKLITIRTERTNPRTLDGNKEKIIGTCTTSGGGYSGGGGNNGTGGQNPHNPPASSWSQYPPTKPGLLSGVGGTRDGGNECDGVCNGSGQYFGYGEMQGTERKAYAPTETKSEASNRSAVIGEPKLRTCLSEGCQKSGITDVSTEPDWTCICEESPKRQLSSNNIRIPLAKANKATSVESELCCPNSRFVCSTELESCPLILNPSESAEISTSTPTCWFNVSDKKNTEDKTTTCIPSCGGRTNQSFPIVKNKCMNTEAIQTEESSYLERISNKNTIKPPSPTYSCNSRCPKRKSKISNSSCTIKIISKPPNVCSLDEKDDDSEMVLRGSVLSVLRKLILSSSKSTQCSQIELEIKNVCSRCMSSINVTASEKDKCSDKAKLNPSCFTCLAKTGIEKNKESDSYLSALKNQRSAVSFKSTAAAGSPYTNASSIFSDTRPICSSLTTRSSFYSCPSDKASEVCCPKINRIYRRIVEVEPSYTKQDATTSTRRSDGFDCRPLKGFNTGHACEKVHSESCACHSDTHMLAQKSQCWSSFSKTQSCCDDNYGFNW